MNFQELMNKATENSKNALKQKKKPGHLHKDSTPNVSNSAIQAFLLKRQQETKKRQVEEEAAKRARIQSRIEQNQNKKTLKRPKPDKDASFTSSSNPTPDSDEQRRAKIPKKETRQMSLANDKVESKSTVSYNRDNSTAMSERQRRQNHSHSRNVEDYKSDSSQRLKNGKITASSTSKKSKSKPPPPDFKELLAIAEQNKLGLKSTKEKSKQINPRQDIYTDSKEKQTTKDRHKKDNQKPVKQEAKFTPKDKIKGHKKEPASNINKAVHRKLSAKSSPPQKTSETFRSIIQDRPQHLGTISGITPRQPSRSYQQNKQRNSMDYYEVDDMDGFIDDEEVDSGMGGDISAHIREIFGYDKRRYRDMEDFDDSTMESSFSQIEKEEVRSSKIAKLEDEIAFLKEQADLKKQKEKLMMDKRKSKKKRN